jgi:hypothetical protein
LLSFVKYCGIAKPDTRKLARRRLFCACHYIKQLSTTAGGLLLQIQGMTDTELASDVAEI